MTTKTQESAQSRSAEGGKVHTIDATGVSLGRLATDIAFKLQGKDRPDFVPHQDNSDTVVVFNTDHMQITGDKLNQKMYYHYSGYPGGIKERPLKRLMKEDSTEVIKKAVYGMLPANRMRKPRLKRLTIHTQALPENK